MSHLVDTGWDFGPVLGLIESDLHSAPPTSSPLAQPAASSPEEHREKISVLKARMHLGSFNKLYQDLGISSSRPPSPVTPDNIGSEGPKKHENLRHGTPFQLNKAATPESLTVQDASSDPQPPGPTWSALGGSTEPAILDTKGSYNRSSVSTPTENAPDRALEVSKCHAGKQAVNGAPKAQKALEKLESESAELEGEKVAKELAEQKQVRANQEQLVTGTIDSSPPHNEPAKLQGKYPTRSNFGAKIRSDTPVQVESTPDPTRRTTSPSKKNKNKKKKKMESVTKPAQTPATPTRNQIPDSATVTQTPVPFTAPLVHNGLIPSSVLPNVQTRPKYQTFNVAGAPGRAPIKITIRPQLDRHVHFHGQLMANFPEERKWLVAPMQLCNEKLAAEGIHVFVDASNIMIGFQDLLRRSGVPRYDLSFDSLALLMERRRPVAKRVSASSHREAAPLAHITRLVDTSKAVGYETNVKEQVCIRREETDRKKFFKAVGKVGWHRALQQYNGSGSDSETGPTTPPTPVAPRWVEQGVDEILHLKMCQSIIDTTAPTTIVLATGDGAEAEHSDGFLAHVERALKKGWKVELLSWRQQLNGGYKKKSFMDKWAGKFRVIELDDYLESLIDTP